MFEQMFRKTPFLKIGVPYIIGIISAELFPVTPSPGWLGIYLSIFIFIFIFLLTRSSFRNVLTGTLLFIFFLVSGHFNSSLKKQKFLLPESGIFTATMLETPVEKPRTMKAEATIKWFADKDSMQYPQEKVILYFAKSDRVPGLRPGSRIIIKASPDAIKNSGNPFAFDYRLYMERRGIRRQVYLKDADWNRVSDHPSPGMKIWAERTRDRLLSIYRENHLEGDVLDVVSALTLGYKKSLDQEVKQVFSNSGAMHVLAVSGLHVGIVFLVFNTVFSFLKRSRLTRGIYLAGALLVLWGYAFLTGLSPSVQRASLMFSLVQVGHVLRRPVNIYNTIFASALILLVFEPQLIADVGFQLSYSAVMGIVYFQPKINAIISARNKVLNFFLGLFTVSIAAQIGTAGLSCFYFRQFPVWFWIANLVVIPVTFFLILMGTLILMFGLFPVVSGFLAKITAWVVETLIKLLHTIESLPGAVYTGFDFDQYSLLISMLIILALVFYIESRRFRHLIVMIFFTGLFVVNATYLSWKGNHQTALIVYDLPEPIVHIIHGKENYLIAPDSMKQKAVMIYDVVNVIKTMGLRQPVRLGFSDEFADRLILKSASWVFYSNHRIALPGTPVKDFDVIDPDVWLRFPGYKGDSIRHDSVVIVTPRHFVESNNSQAIIHELSVKGAFTKISPYRAGNHHITRTKGGL